MNLFDLLKMCNEPVCDVLYVLFMGGVKEEYPLDFIPYAYLVEEVQMWEIDYDWEGFSWISNDDNSQSVIAFRRIDTKGKEIIAVCNFVPVQRDNYKIGVPKRGSYEVVLNSDDEKFGGKGRGSKGRIRSKKEGMHGFENSISLDLPPLSVIYLKNVPPRKKTTGTKKSNNV